VPNILVAWSQDDADTRWESQVRHQLGEMALGVLDVDRAEEVVVLWCRPASPYVPTVGLPDRRVTDGIERQQPGAAAQADADHRSPAWKKRLDPETPAHSALRPRHHAASSHACGAPRRMRRSESKAQRVRNAADEGVPRSRTMPQDPGVTEWWTSRRFSLTNPRDDGSTDLPRLLRRMADEVERRDLDPMDILDLTVSQEMTADGPWWSATIYWSPDDDEPGHSRP
jgi:hypothetical protein